MARHNPFLDKPRYDETSNRLDPQRNISLESAVSAAGDSRSGGAHCGYAARFLSILPAPVRYAAVSVGLAAALLAGSLGGLACKPQPEPGSYWLTVTPTPPPPTPPPVEAALKKMNKELVDLVVQKPWFLDGLSKAELYFLEGWAANFTNNPLAAKPNPESLAGVKDFIENLPNSYVNGTVKTIQGDLEVIITFLPEKTSREHAEHVRDIYIATIPALEQYLNQPFPELSRNRGKVHAVFIDREGDGASSPISILTKHNTILDLITHEHAQNATDFGPYFWNEGIPEYVGLKALAIAIGEKPELAALAEEFYIPKYFTKPLTPASIMNEYYEYSKNVLTNNKSNGVPQISLKASDMEQWEPYKVPLSNQIIWVYVFMKDLETAVGEDAMRDSIRSLVQRYAEDATGRSIGSHIKDTHEQVYKAMQEGVRQYAPDRLPAFDKLWEDRVFGPEKFALIKQ